MAKRFLFLEVVDQEIVALIAGLREVATGQTSRSGVHVTIRGPYNREIPLRQIEQYQRILRTLPLVLDGIGYFGAGQRHIIYIKVQHPALRRLWWKPDFPIEKYGFNPHITVYEGDSLDRANGVKRFLATERLKLLTWNFRVTSYVSDHADLFQSSEGVEHLFLGLVNKRLVRADILARMGRTLGVDPPKPPARAVAI